MKWFRAATAAAGTLLLAAAANAQDPKPGNVDKGRDVYEQHCVGCHGQDMVNPGTVSFDLRKFPREAKPRFINSVMNGRGQGMPAWKGMVSPEELEHLWAYVLSGGK